MVPLNLPYPTLPLLLDNIHGVAGQHARSSACAVLQTSTRRASTRHRLACCAGAPAPRPRLLFGGQVREQLRLQRLLHAREVGVCGLDDGAELPLLRGTRLLARHRRRRLPCGRPSQASAQRIPGGGTQPERPTPSLLRSARVLLLAPAVGATQLAHARAAGMGAAGVPSVVTGRGACRCGAQGSLAVLRRWAPAHLRTPQSTAAARLRPRTPRGWARRAPTCRAPRTDRQSSGWGRQGPAPGTPRTCRTAPPGAGRRSCRWKRHTCVRIRLG